MKVLKYPKYNGFPKFLKITSIRKHTHTCNWPERINNTNTSILFVTYWCIQPIHNYKENRWQYWNLHHMQMRIHHISCTLRHILSVNSEHVPVPPKSPVSFYKIQRDITVFRLVEEVEFPKLLSRGECN